MNNQINVNFCLSFQNKKYSLEQVNYKNFLSYMGLYQKGIFNGELNFNSVNADLQTHLEKSLKNKKVLSLLIKEDDFYIGFIRFCFDGIVLKENKEYFQYLITKTQNKKEIESYQKTIFLFNDLLKQFNKFIEIDIYIDNLYRNKKISYNLLNCFFDNNKNNEFYVRIDNKNINSLKLFNKLNFKPIENQSTLVYEKWQNLKILTQ